MPVSEAQDLIQLVINLGFAAAMAIFIFVAYQKLVNRLADIIEGNTKAMTELKAVIANLCRLFYAGREKKAEEDTGVAIVEPRTGGRRWYDDPGGE